MILLGKTKVNLNKQTFTFSPTTLVDIAHDTEAKLEGSITHQQFERWFLNFDLTTNNLLILDTEESDDIPYYGTGFLEGEASINGLYRSVSD